MVKIKRKSKKSKELLQAIVVKGHKNHMKDEMSFAKFKIKQSHLKSKLQNCEKGHKCLCHRK